MNLYIDLSLVELAFYFFGLTNILASITIYGTRRTGLFFLGVVILVVFNEHVNVFLERYNYLWQILGRDMKYFSNYTDSIGGNLAWLGILPGYIFPGWFMGVMGAYITSRALFPKAGTLSVSIFTALQVIVIGFVAENLGHINNWWEYTSLGKTCTIFDGVWFAVYIYYLGFISSLILIFETTIINKEDFNFLTGIENSLFTEKSEFKIYCFRMTVFSIITCVVTHGLDLFVLRHFAG